MIIICRDESRFLLGDVLLALLLGVLQGVELHQVLALFG